MTLLALVALLAVTPETPPPPPAPPPLVPAAPEEPRAPASAVEPPGPVRIHVSSEVPELSLYSVGSQIARCRAPCGEPLDIAPDDALELRSPDGIVSRQFTVGELKGDVSVSFTPRNTPVWGAGLTLTIVGGLLYLGGGIAAIGGLFIIGLQALFSGGGSFQACCLDAVGWDGLAVLASSALLTPGLILMLVTGAQKLIVKGAEE